MEGIREEFSQLDGSTATPEDDIPEEMFKSTIDVHVSLLTKITRSSFQNRYFPDKLKAVEVTPIFKKVMTGTKAWQCFVLYVKGVWQNHVYPNWKCHGRQFIKIAYRAVCWMLLLSLELLTDFRKNHSAQYCLVNILEKWKSTLDKGGIFCAMFMDLMIDYHCSLCWQDVKILQLRCLNNCSYTKNGMLIKVNKLKLIWNNVKERKSYNKVIKQISGSYP